MTVAVKLSTALRTFLLGKVEARADATVGKKLTPTAFGADVVGRQGINLGDTRHRSNEGGADRTS